MRLAELQENLDRVGLGADARDRVAVRGCGQLPAGRDLRLADYLALVRIADQQQRNASAAEDEKRQLAAQSIVASLRDEVALLQVQGSARASLRREQEALAALGGDAQAASVLLTRVLGRPREEAPDVFVELPDLRTAAGCADAAALLASEAALGRVPADVASRWPTCLPVSRPWRAVADDPPRRPGRAPRRT